jgi:glycyl-tRNA synthetase
MDMDKLVSLCKRRGFIFQSSEIYGGLNGFWDYGPMGVELKKNIKDAWWQDMVRNPPPGPDGEEIQMVGLDCAIIMNPKVWVASGHVGGFQDPMQTCRQCKKLYRSDQVIDMLGEAEWVKSISSVLSIFPGHVTIPKQKMLLQTCSYEVGELMKWAANKGKRLAPGLAIVRNPNQVRGALENLLRENPQPAHIAVLGVVSCGEITFSACPSCGGDLTQARQFNLMFETFVGAVRDEENEENKAYLRPETAQGIFVNFRNVLDSTRLKLPFGIAQVGKAFRNEINPRNFTFRSREFEQMEIEFFCHPDESMKWYQYWRDVRIRWYSQLGIRSDKLRPREQGKDELAHYSIATTDIEYLFPFSDEPQELEGVAHRGAYDLTQHMQLSKKDLSYFDEDAWNALLAQKLEPFKDDKKRREEEKKKLEREEKPKYGFVPHVIEPSAGADRFTLAVLCEAYSEDKVPDEKGVPQERIVMRFHPRLAPIKAAVLPLVKRDGMPEIAQKLYRDLKQEFNVFYDEGGAVGRRYRRQDEVGTPWCITIDGQTLQDQTVTVRDRDTLKQWRVPLSGVAEELRERLRGAR